MKTSMKWWPWHQAHADAQQELDRAREQLVDVRNRWPDVRRAAEVMREHRERNGFADQIRQAMGAREP